MLIWNKLRTNCHRWKTCTLVNRANVKNVTKHFRIPTFVFVHTTNEYPIQTGTLVTTWQQNNFYDVAKQITLPQQTATGGRVPHDCGWRMRNKMTRVKTLDELKRLVNSDVKSKKQKLETWFKRQAGWLDWRLISYWKWTQLWTYETENMILDLLF